MIHVSPYHKYLYDTSATTSIKYALLASIVSVSIIAGGMQIGTALSNTFSNASVAVK